MRTCSAVMCSISSKGTLLIGPRAASLHKFAISAPEYPNITTKYSINPIDSDLSYLICISYLLRGSTLRFFDDCFEVSLRESVFLLTHEIRDDLTTSNSFRERNVETLHEATSSRLVDLLRSAQIKISQFARARNQGNLFKFFQIRQVT